MARFRGAGRHVFQILAALAGCFAATVIFNVATYKLLSGLGSSRPFSKAVPVSAGQAFTLVSPMASPCAFSFQAIWRWLSAKAGRSELIRLGPRS